MKCYEAVEGNSGEVREQNPKLIGIPFNSRNKYQVLGTGTMVKLTLVQASVHEMASGQHRLVMKGAPEMVFKRCSSILLGGQEVGVHHLFCSPCSSRSRIGGYRR